MTKPGFSFFILILFGSTFSYGCMFACVVLDSVFQYYAKRLAANNVSEVNHFVLGGTLNLNSINQSVHTCFLIFSGSWCCSCWT